MNFDKHPNEFTTLVGLTRGYAANGDNKNALKYATMALPLAPDPQNKTNIENIVQKLKEGKDINWVNNKLQVSNPGMEIKGKSLR